MFVFNIKVNRKIFIRFFIVSIIILISILLFFSIKKICFEVSNTAISDNNKINTTIEIKTDNFTKFLEDCNENINNYVGKNIHINGFVYRLSNFSKNQFVVARLMPLTNNKIARTNVNYNKIIYDKQINIHIKNINFNIFDKDINTFVNKNYNNNYNYGKDYEINYIFNLNDNCVVVGIMCEGDNLSNFSDNSWVDIYGTIKKANYNKKGEIPVIQISKINQIEPKLQEIFVEQP